MDSDAPQASQDGSVEHTSNVPLPIFLAAANILSEGATSNPIVDPRKRKKKKKKVGPTRNTESTVEEPPVVVAIRRSVPLEENRVLQSGSSSQMETQVGASGSNCLMQEAQRSGSPINELSLDLIQKLWLDVNHMATLKKRSPKHPSAIFVCKLCQYFCTSLEHCENHVKDQKHLRNSLEEGRYNTLVSLPQPTENHLQAITELLCNASTSLEMTQEDKEKRKQIADEINTLISQNMPGCEARLYGSSLTGFGLKNSNLNLDFVVEHSLNAAILLKGAFNLLSASDLVTCVKSDFYAEIPSVLFYDKTKNYNCVLSLNSHEAYKTSELLAKYYKIDHRYRTLCTAFRLWAKLCKVDDHLIGLLPSYSYNLMLVYFLQQLDPPVLPILKESDTEISWKTKNSSSIGDLWLQLLRFYSIIHPFSDNVVNVRSDVPIRRGEKHWTGKKIAIEDPFHRKRNVSRYILNHASHEYIMECFKCTYKYFGIPQTDIGPIFAFIRTPMEEYRQIPDVEKNIRLAEQAMDDLMNNDDRFIKAQPMESPIQTSLNNMISVSELEERFRDASLQNNSEMPDVSVIESRTLKNGPAIRTSQPENAIRPGHYSQLVVSPKLASALCSRLRKECYLFQMDGKIFTAGKQPPIVCNICQQEGHTKTRCPDNYLPPLEPLPPMTEEFLQEIDTVCQQILKYWAPTIEEIEERRVLVSGLENYLRKNRETIKLELFGSSCNGFGFHRSDLDICLTFSNIAVFDKSSKGAAKLFEELAVELKGYGKLTNLIAITTAKVPIVKFTYPKSKLDCDISLYNTLAQRNTRMLKMYSEIDIRVKVLGFTMKRFAKLCEICDASRGSLSSYAYILMVLYFLQQCDPPVIPVLQQMYTTATKPVLEVDDHNTWFYDNLETVPNDWPGYKQNQCSAGELWLQLLRFYTEEFDFNEHVVSIRQKEKVLRFEKLWNSKCIAIEDPFDLTHNLGSGLSRKMNNFIIKAFRRGRMHFGSPITRLLPPYKELQDYLFDSKYLTDGQPPNDRGCRICKKIGHICKVCPQRKNGKRRQNDKKARDHMGNHVQENKERGQQQTQQRSNTPFRVQEGQGWGHQRNRGEQSRGQQEPQQKQLPSLFRSYPNDQSNMQLQQQQQTKQQLQQHQTQQQLQQQQTQKQQLHLQQQSLQPRITPASAPPAQISKNYLLLENPRAGASKRELCNDIEPSMRFRPNVGLEETTELAQVNAICDVQPVKDEVQPMGDTPQTPNLVMMDQAIQICSTLQKQNDITSSMLNGELTSCVGLPNEMLSNSVAQNLQVNSTNTSHNILPTASSPITNMANVLDNLRNMIQLEQSSQLEINKLGQPLISHNMPTSQQASNASTSNSYVYNENTRHPFNLPLNPVHVSQITQMTNTGNHHGNGLPSNSEYKMTQPPPGFQNAIPCWINKQQQTPYCSVSNTEEEMSVNKPFMSYDSPPTPHVHMTSGNAESHGLNMSTSRHVGISTFQAHSNFSSPMATTIDTPMYKNWPGLHRSEIMHEEAAFQQQIPQQQFCNGQVLQTPTQNLKWPSQ